MKHALSAITVLAIAAVAILPASAYPGPTKVITYNAAGMKTTKTAKGSCWTSSNASPRSDAFRCMVGNTIMDPCFKVSRKAVNCPQNVPANTGTTIGLTKPLPQANAKSAAKPWTFQVAGGSTITCNAGTGTVVGNYPYYCTGNMVCAVPAASTKWPTTYMTQCGTPTGPITVKGGHAAFVMTLWR